MANCPSISGSPRGSLVRAAVKPVCGSNVQTLSSLAWQMYAVLDAPTGTAVDVVDHDPQRNMHSAPGVAETDIAALSCLFLSGAQPQQ